MTHAPLDAHTVHPAVVWREAQVASAAAFAHRLDASSFFTGRTAAALWRLPVPPAESPLIEVGTLIPARGFRRRDVVSRRYAARAVRVVSRNGLRLTDPATTWALVAPELKLHEAVALGDAAIHRPRYPGTSRLKRPPLATSDELLAAVAVPYRRQREALARLLPLLSSQSASPPETHLRLCLAEWGFPEPTLDYDVYDNAGRLLGCSEIAFPKFKIACEYEGDHHRVDRAQWNRDIEKYRDYAANGWEPIRVTARMLYRERDRLQRQLWEVFRRRALR